MGTINIELKKRCVEASNSGIIAREVYDTVFYPEHTAMSFECFRHKLAKWRKQQMCDSSTLNAGTYGGFTANRATVQVNGKGEVVQAWVKQTRDEDEQYARLIETIKESTEPITAPAEEYDGYMAECMLEIGLYDMHFGLPNDYSVVFNELINIIGERHREEVNIILGQDLFHNDDFRGRTSKGSPIEKVDIAKAWNEAKVFWCSVITEAQRNADRVKITYVKGNHDESLAWAFVQMLHAMFPNIEVDDSMKVRKCISWKGCFIGLTHGNETKGTPNDLRGQFTIAFPAEFAAANVREIHCGHLHHEREADIYGVMVRRLSTGNVTDEWSDDSGFIGAHKRFMVFEWKPNRLSAIYYLGGEKRG